MIIVLAWEYSRYLLLLCHNLSVFKQFRQSFLGLVGLLAELILCAHFGERKVVVLHPSPPKNKAIETWSFSVSDWHSGFTVVQSCWSWRIDIFLHKNCKLQLIEIKVLRQTGKECFEEAKALFHMTSSQVMPGISAFTIPKHSRFFSPLWGNAIPDLVALVIQIIFQTWQHVAVLFFFFPKVLLQSSCLGTDNFFFPPTCPSYSQLCCWERPIVSVRHRTPVMFAFTSLILKLRLKWCCCSARKGLFSSGGLFKFGCVEPCF